MPGADDDQHRTFVRWVLQDWDANVGYRDSQLVLALFRAAQRLYTRGGRLGRQLCVPYEIATSLLVGVELPPQLVVGPRLKIFHPHSIVINPRVTMGSDCVLRQNVTVGNVTRRDGTEKGVASVGSGVEFGAGCAVVGDVHVGDHARIGALSLVLKDVPDYGVVVGNPGRLVRVEGPDQAVPKPE